MLKKFFLFIGIFFILTCNLWSQDYIEKILIQGNQRVELSPDLILIYELVVSNSTL